jgi:hypothetical protein
MRKYLWLAKRVNQLPAGYKQRTNTVVEGRAKTGEISRLGLVSHRETWEGRIASNAAPSAIRYIRTPDGQWRHMTFGEMVDRGYFILGKGPAGVREQQEGIHE